MSVSDEAVEAAYDVSQHLLIATAEIELILTAAAPFIAAQATALISELIDPDPCSFDHNHSCQAHGYYYLAQGEACPQHEAKEWVKGLTDS